MSNGHLSQKPRFFRRVNSDSISPLGASLRPQRCSTCARPPCTARTRGVSFCSLVSTCSRRRGRRKDGVENRPGKKNGNKGKWVLTIFFWNLSNFIWSSDDLTLERGKWSKVWAWWNIQKRKDEKNGVISDYCSGNYTTHYNSKNGKLTSFRQPLASMLWPCCEGAHKNHKIVRFSSNIQDIWQNMQTSHHHFCARAFVFHNFLGLSNDINDPPESSISPPAPAPWVPLFWPWWFPEDTGVTVPAVQR